MRQKRHLRVLSETSDINRVATVCLEQAVESGKQIIKMENRPATFVFALASLLPAGLLLVAAAFGGVWPLLALLSMTLLVFALDRTIGTLEAAASLSDWLPKAAGLAHLAVLVSVVVAVAERDGMPIVQDIILIVAAGLYAGQVSNACAHELIHRPDRASRALGTAIYCSLLNGQHVSAHLLVHHVHAGTSNDPNSAPLGMSFYRYMIQAWTAEFCAGWHAENARRRLVTPWGLHPYTVYLGIAAIFLAAAALIGGMVGLISFIAIALHAQMQLFLSDYIQHYGLRRAISADGKPEPMGPQHSWNAPHPYSSALMMSAPRHSDHHMRPGRHFTELTHDPRTMPTLPRSVPVMGAIAFVPPLWRRMMDARAARWSGDLTPPTAPESAPVISFVTR